MNASVLRMKQNLPTQTCRKLRVKFVVKTKNKVDDKRTFEVKEPSDAKQQIHGLKAQKLIAQGITLGWMRGGGYLRPVRTKACDYHVFVVAFALTGRTPPHPLTQGGALGYKLLPLRGVLPHCSASQTEWHRTISVYIHEAPLRTQHTKYHSNGMARTNTGQRPCKSLMLRCI